MSKEEGESTDRNNEKIRLFVRIQGLSPFQLHQRKGLRIKSYLEIVERYYSDLYSGKPPGTLIPHRVIVLNNGDKLMEFRRKETLAMKFFMEVQLNTNVYDELPPCKESVLMVPCPTPDIYEYMTPKVISLNRLILLLSDPGADDFLLTVFWYTYRSFTNPKVILQKMIERFDVPPVACIHDQRTNDQDTRIHEMYYNMEVKSRVQMKVGRILVQWVTDYFFDFDDDMVTELTQFCTTRLKPNGYLGLNKRLLTLIQRNNRTPLWKVPAVPIEDVVSVEIERASKFGTISDTEFSILDMSDQDIADTITFIDHHLYSQIKFSEMLDQSWNKDKKRHMAPNILNNINFLNKVSCWVSYIILLEENVLVRKKIIKKFVRIMVILNKQNSFNMLLALHSGLNNASVHRLSNTWTQMSEKILTLREKTTEVLSGQKNSRALRDRMNKVYTDDHPSSPYLGIYLKDIVFTDDGNPTFIDGKINFHKCIFTYNLMFQSLRFQQRKYDLAPNLFFLRYLLKFEKVDDSKLFALSLLRQPKQPSNLQ